MASSKRRRFEDDDDDFKVVDRSCCGVSYLKNLLYIFNILLFLSGVALLSVGVWVLFDRFSSISFFLSNWYKGLTYSTLSCGVLVVLVSFIGCCSARLRNYGCLGLFSTLLMLIFLAEISLGILAYFYEFMIEGEMTRTLNTTIASEYSFNEVSTRSIDDLQRQMKCCGALSYKDWRRSAWMANYTRLATNPLTSDAAAARFKTPDSCCISETVGCGIRHHPSNIYTEGCEENLADSVRLHLKIMGAVGLGLSCLQIFGVIFSCCFIKRLQNWRHRQKVSLWTS